MNLKGQFEAMIASDAWKALEAWVAHECDESMRRHDSKPANDLKINEYCEDRGIRKGMRKVLQQAHSFSEGR